jgi:RNA polymerase sigma-B factor
VEVQTEPEDEPVSGVEESSTDFIQTAHLDPAAALENIASVDDADERADEATFESTDQETSPLTAESDGAATSESDTTQKGTAQTPERQHARAGAGAPRRRGRPRRTSSLPSTEFVDDVTSTQDEGLPEGEGLDVADWHADVDDDNATANAEAVSDEEPRRTTRATSAHGEFDAVFREWTRTRDPRLRERLILMNRNLVSYIARRFMDRGEMSEDIVQQGLIGLINALDHFDPSRGVRFATFATPTIMGEIRRYFRDKSWGIRVPRRLQELNQVINNRIEDLTQELNRSPTYAEIARALNLPIEDVVEALEMGSAMEPISIDEEISFGRDEPGTSVGDQIGECDPQLEGWGDYAALETALQKLPEKERRVLQLAYFHDHSQVEIARHMKVSQMFVSRLQRRALAHLRELMNSQDV